MQPTSCSELILVAGMIAMIYVFVRSHLSSTWLQTDNCLLLMLTILVGFKTQTKKMEVNKYISHISSTCKQKLYNDQQQCVMCGRKGPLTF